MRSISKELNCCKISQKHIDLAILLVIKPICAKNDLR